MHSIQIAIINLSKHQDLSGFSLRRIAELIGVPGKPQIVKHHLLQLSKVGLMQVDLQAGIIKLVARGYHLKQSGNAFYSLPIMGAANCGPARVFADECIQGYLKVSTKMLPRRKQDLYIVVADGPSMNKAELHPGLTIGDGDFVVVDSSYQTPRHGDIVVAIIDGMAAIKRYQVDQEHDRIVLESESTEKFLPIFVHAGDDFAISGKVVDVIKKPKNSQ